ncbi:TetR/AcrR family transcriptional regulator [Nocardia brasiliensis]|uniref:TetR/AcrR family transcriptional regulator n=1 Tax=Nocardia brasiliensis TaxID=37326 RepID=UPI001892DD79|nr:TetR/AcrR family transcriptional regulator [Nocardia brasiliensis]MBF6542489.1 TetR/AcrR family transcriptional regulator [Nocardia brasiliensis]
MTGTPKQRRPVRPYGGVGAADRVAARRDKLLAAGLELFGTRGYPATGVKDLCRTAGLTDRYFYESFGGTAELFAAVFDQVIDELFAAVAVAVDAVPATGTRKLRAGIGTYLTALAEDARKMRIVFVEPAGAGAEQRMREALWRFARLVARTATAARPETEPPAELVDIYALSVVGMLERVLVEKEGGRLDVPMDELVDYCTAFAAASLVALYTGRITKQSGRPEGRSGTSD